MKEKQILLSLQKFTEHEYFKKNI